MSAPRNSEHWLAPGVLQRMPARRSIPAEPMRRTTAVLLSVLAIELGASLLMVIGSLWGHQ